MILDKKKTTTLYLYTVDTRIEWYTYAMYFKKIMCSSLENCTFQIIVKK